MRKANAVAARGTLSGFTLIELLVVVAIIAVLVSILLPALSQARETAKTASCASNQRQLGLAFQTYANEYNGWLPYCYDWTPGETNRMWRIILPRLYFGGVGPENLPVFHCPSETRSLAFDYGMNAYINNIESAWSPILARLDLLPDHTRTVLLADNQPYTLENSTVVPWLWPGSGSQINPRHAGKANLLFCDGHAASYMGYPLNVPWEQWFIYDQTVWKYWQY